MSDSREVQDTMKNQHQATVTNKHIGIAIHIGTDIVMPQRCLQVDIHETVPESRIRYRWIFIDNGYICKIIFVESREDRTKFIDSHEEINAYTWDAPRHVFDCIQSTPPSELILSIQSISMMSLIRSRTILSSKIPIFSDMPTDGETGTESIPAELVQQLFIDAVNENLIFRIPAITNIREIISIRSFWHTGEPDPHIGHWTGSSKLRFAANGFTVGDNEAVFIVEIAWPETFDPPKHPSENELRSYLSEIKNPNSTIKAWLCDADVDVNSVIHKRIPGIELLTEASIPDPIAELSAWSDRSWVVTFLSDWIEFLTIEGGNIG